MDKAQLLTAILTGIQEVPGRLKRVVLATGFTRLLFPDFYTRKTILDRVGRIVADRLFVIQDDWAEHLEDHDQAPEFAAARNRARVREVNAILAAMKRDFPAFELPAGVDPLDMQITVSEMVKGRPAVKSISVVRSA